MSAAALAGFSLGFSLILAIGAQNAFVLRQGLVRRHVALVCALCAGSDALLIGAGVVGFGEVVRAVPWIEMAARYGGAAFLGVYGGLRFWAALGPVRRLRAAEADGGGVGRVAATCLAFTWLNPHVYLDTVVLLGSLSTQYAPYGAVFWGGAAVASFVFFFGLGYGARLLAPVFEKPAAWRGLDFVIGVVMVGIAVGLVAG